MATAPLVEDILNIEPEEAMELHIREGFPYRSIEALQRYLDITQAELAAALGVSRQTVIRNQKQQKHLSSQMSDQLYRVARVARRAVEVFGNHEVATKWLKLPNGALGGRAPLSLLDTDAGAEKVTDVLGRIEYGVYS